MTASSMPDSNPSDSGQSAVESMTFDRLGQAQHLSQDESINLAGVTRILALAEENRQLRRQLRRSHQSQGSSMFAAAADGRVVEVRRSSRARLWRQDTTHDEADPTDSKSLIVWSVRS